MSPSAILLYCVQKAFSLPGAAIFTLAGSFLFGSFVGTLYFANAGRQLGSINSLSEIASPPALCAFALLGLLALVPILYRKVAGKRASLRP